MPINRSCAFPRIYLKDNSIIFIKRGFICSKLMNYLFLHGLVGEPDNWTDTIGVLQAKGALCHISRIDFLRDKYNSLDELAAKIYEPFLDSFLPQESIVVGNSLGCILAMSIGTSFYRVVLANPHTETKFGRITRHHERFYKELEKLFYDPSKLSPELKAHYWDIWSSFISSRANIKRLREIKKMSDGYNQEEKYEQLQDRITIVCGKEDQLSPVSYFEDLAKRHPKIRLHIIEECGHAIPIEKPEELAELLIAISN